MLATRVSRELAHDTDACWVGLFFSLLAFGLAATRLFFFSLEVHETHAARRPCQTGRKVFRTILMYFIYSQKQNGTHEVESEGVVDAGY